MFVKIIAPLLAVLLTVVTSDLTADINSPQVQDALHFAVAQYNAQSDSLYASQAVKVIKAQMQIYYPSGVKYIFTVEMARTSCKKGEAENTCAINSDPEIAQPHKCKLAVWSRPWLHSMMLFENTC